MDLRSHIYVAISLILYTALIWGARAKGYLRYLKFTHLSTQTKQDIYLKDVILGLSWPVQNKQKLTACKIQGIQCVILIIIP